MSLSSWEDCKTTAKDFEVKYIENYHILKQDDS